MVFEPRFGAERRQSATFGANPRDSMVPSLQFGAVAADFGPILGRAGVSESLPPQSGAPDPLTPAQSFTAQATPSPLPMHPMLLFQIEAPGTVTVVVRPPHAPLFSSSACMQPSPSVSPSLSLCETSPAPAPLAQVLEVNVRRNSSHDAIVRVRPAQLEARTVT